MLEMLDIFLINIAVVVLAVIVHYEFLYRLNRYIPQWHVLHRYRIVIGLLGALLAHAIEIWLFALAYYFAVSTDALGVLSGSFEGTLLDCVYYSFTVFTTLGFGDIFPEGDIRFLTGIESLTGLVLITGTASYLFLDMQRYWNDNK